MSEKLMTIKEVSEFLNVKESWVRSAIFRKNIPFVKIGHHVRFRQQDLLEWVEKNKSTQTKRD